MTVIVNQPATGIPYFTPDQTPRSGTAYDPQPDGSPIPKLFQPLRIRGLEFHNRIFLSPLCQYSAQDGHVTPWHTAHIGGIVTRGPGLTMIEASAVLPEGRITPQDAGIWSDSHIPALAELVTLAHSQNQKIAIQIAHAGRKASTVAPWLSFAAIAYKEVGGWPDNVRGPSAIKFQEEGFPDVKEMTKADIKDVVKAFTEGAKRAVKAGFDVIEIHNAHGYLLSSFLSPMSNKRTDEYGGSFENRTRLTLEVVDAVRAVIPEDMPLFMRISATEYLEQVFPNEPSWTVDDTVKLSAILFEHGVDLLDVSSGGNHPKQQIKTAPVSAVTTGPAYQAPFAGAVRASALTKPNSQGKTLLVGAVGGISTGQVAQDVLDKEWADVCFVGRAFQKNPGVVWEFAEQLGVMIHVAKQIGWGFIGRGNRGVKAKA